MAGFRAVVDARVSTVTDALVCMCCDSDSSTRSNPSPDKKMNMVLRRWPEANWDMIVEVVALVISDSIDEADGGGSKMADAMRLMRLMHHRVMSASEVLAPAAPPLSIDRRGRVSKQLLQNECVFKRFVAYSRARRMNRMRDDDDERIGMRRSRQGIINRGGGFQKMLIM